MPMSFRSEFMRNLRILGLISVCFTAGVFVAEYVGNFLQPEPVEAMSTGSPADAPSDAENTGYASQEPVAELATLPEASRQLP